MKVKDVIILGITSKVVTSFCFCNIILKCKKMQRISERILAVYYLQSSAASVLICAMLSSFSADMIFTVVSA